MKQVLSETADGICTLTIDRETKRNALDRATLHELVAAFGGAAGEPEVRVILLRGAGDRAFCAGADLEEMLGNLIDNSSKWAKSRVQIGCSTTDDRLEITVEDDGPGIDRAEFENVMRRGHKLDESKPGHGQGLGIVKDIAALYGGSLMLANSELGGLQAKLDLPSA